MGRYRTNVDELSNKNKSTQKTIAGTKIATLCWITVCLFAGCGSTSPSPRKEKICNDYVDCTLDEYDEAMGSCLYLPHDELCASNQVCNPSKGCVPLPECSRDSDCDDGKFCNGAERCCKSGDNCTWGTCQPGAPPDCSDGISCTTDTCDESTKSCVHVADHTACGENQLCNVQQGCRSVGLHPEPGRMLIIAAEPLLSAAEEYRVYRQATGFDVELSSTQELKTNNPNVSLLEAIKGRIKGFVKPNEDTKKLHILLIGDASSVDYENTDYIPVASNLTGDVGDTPYADIDGDGVPDLSIGRIPFSKSLDVMRYLYRIWDYEATYSPGTWNKTINVYGGESGWGIFLDASIESIAAEVFESISYDFDITITYASSSSAYYLPPTEWQNDYSERYQEGAVLMPYIGHTLGEAVCCQGDPPARRGLLAFFSCFDGEFQYFSSLADEILLRDQGPVATLGATNLSSAYTNAIFPLELAYAIFNLRTQTYGSAIRLAKYNVINNTNSDLQNVRATIDLWGFLLINGDNSYIGESLAEVNLRNTLIYNLLGDPAAPIHLPQGSVAFAAPPAPLPKGKTVTIQGVVFENKNATPMVSGELTVTLEVQRSVLVEQISPCDPTADTTQTCLAKHESSNNKVVSQINGSVVNGMFSVQLAVPATLPSAQFYLKAYAKNALADAVGSLPVNVK